VASFITTDEQLQLSRGCYFPMQTMFPEGFPFTFLSLIAMRESLEPSYRYNIILDILYHIINLFYTSSNNFETTSPVKLDVVQQPASDVYIHNLTLEYA